MENNLGVWISGLISAMGAGAFASGWTGAFIAMFTYTSIFCLAVCIGTDIKTLTKDKHYEQ